MKEKKWKQKIHLTWVEINDSGNCTPLIITTHTWDMLSPSIAHSSTICVGRANLPVAISVESTINFTKYINIYVTMYRYIKFQVILAFVFGVDTIVVDVFLEELTNLYRGLLYTMRFAKLSFMRHNFFFIRVHLFFLFIFFHLLNLPTFCSIFFFMSSVIFNFVYSSYIFICQVTSFGNNFSITSSIKEQIYFSFH